MEFVVNPTILASEDCFACRRCCQYEPDELMDAPMFTGEQRARAEQEFAVNNLRFEQQGRLWRLLLDPIPGSDKSICPLFDQDTAHCRVRDYEIFDCLTWPFYIMRYEGRIVITLSQDCPAMAKSDIENLQQYAREVIGPKMRVQADKYPDLITEYHGNVIILCNI